MNKKHVYSVCLLLLCGMLVIGAADTSIHLNVSENIETSQLSPSSVRTWRVFTSSFVDVNFADNTQQQVRGEVSLRLISPDSTALTVDTLLKKAYMKIKFPHTRLTIGKTALSWGDALVFNAADVLHSTDTLAFNFDATGDSSQTMWLTSLLIPTSNFSFIETTVILPTISPFDIEEAKAGIRFYSGEQAIKFEAGYATTKGSSSRLHHPYIALQGNVGFDWYIAASLALPSTGSLVDHAKTSLDITGGALYMVPIAYQHMLNIRFEWLYRPWQQWPNPQDNPGYTVLFYPELSLSIGSDATVALRAIVSPIDMSAMVSLQGVWNVMQNLSLQAVALSSLGDSTDLFKPYNPAAISIGADWTF